MRRVHFVFSIALFLAPLAAQGWVDRSTANGPAPRYSHAMCYDAARGYVLLFGGVGYSSSSPGYVVFNDTWTWNGTTWTFRQSINIPNVSTNSDRAVAMAYHAATSQPLLVSGGGSYSWNGLGWVQQASPPGGQLLAPYMEYDPARTETVLFQLNSAPNIVYIWNGSSWSTRQSLTTPTVGGNGGSPPQTAVDPVTRRVVLGGIGSSGNWYWEWTGLLWQQRYPQIPAPPAPTAFFGAMTGDTVHGRIVMLDILNNNFPQQPNHTWTISNGVTSQLTTPTEPSWRNRSAMTFDSARGVCVLFGGSNGLPMGDTWEFDLGSGPAYSTFGVGCLGIHGRPAISAQGSSLPRVGQTFNLQVNNLPFTGPVFLFLGLSDQTYLGYPLPLGLTSAGAPTCALLCSGDQLHLVTNVLGSAVWSFPVPPFPGATFFNQALVLDPSANALGLTTSNGGRGVIGM